MGHAPETRLQTEKQNIQTLDELRQRLTEEWERMEQRIIDNDVKQ